MNISKLIDFSKINKDKVLFNGTKQWEILHKMNESEWKAYTKVMAEKKILVKYDTQSNAYIAKLIKETSMPNLMPVKNEKESKFLLQDDEMDMESDAMELINAIDSVDDETENVPTEILPPVAPPAAIKSIESINSPSIDLTQFEELLNKILGGAKGEVEVPGDMPQTQDVEKISFLGNPLDSEFEVNSDQISYLNSKSSETYMSSIDSKYSKPKTEEKFEDEESEELNEFDNFGDTTESLKEADDEEEFTEVGEEESDDEEVEDENDEEEEVAPVTKSGTAKINGKPVQIILTGVMITPSEIEFVSESTSKAGMKLTKVIGKGKNVNFIVEDSGKQYTIKYTDTTNKKPFSIKQFEFKTLNETLQKINEVKNFKRLVDGDIVNRKLTNLKETNIISEYDGKISKDYLSDWSVKSVGTVNLKNGMNETYSNVTSHSTEENVLVKTKDGQFFMMKGNLKERSKIGTKKNLVDLYGKREFGIGTVVGLYENSLKGLGQIMYRTKKTILPLLTWK